MDAFSTHVVIVGGPEVEAELLAIVLDDGEAIPLFESVEEAEEFLDSTGDFAGDWRAREVSARELVELLEFQGEEVAYVALSPPPERWEGGMEVQVVPRESMTALLERQAEFAEQAGASQPPERRGFWQRLLGHYRGSSEDS